MGLFLAALLAVWLLICAVWKGGAWFWVGFVVLAGYIVLRLAVGRARMRRLP
jgi:Flp pilus assembly protein TadB